MKNFDIKTRINFGESALDRLEELDKQKILVIADPFVIKSGLIEHITLRLERSGKDYEIFSDVVPDPPIVRMPWWQSAAARL